MNPEAFSLDFTRCRIFHPFFSPPALKRNRIQPFSSEIEAATLFAFSSTANFSVREKERSRYFFFLTLVRFEKIIRGAIENVYMRVRGTSSRYARAYFLISIFNISKSERLKSQAKKVRPIEISARMLCAVMRLQIEVGFEATKSTDLY